MAMLFPHLPFHPDETPLSWAARSAAFHTGGRLVPFLNDLGIDLWSLKRGEECALARLCSISGQERAPVADNAVTALGERKYALRGERFAAEFLTGPVTRFCPSCLEEDAVGAARPATKWRHRLIWSLSVVRVCPVHQSPLLSHRGGNWDDGAHELQALPWEKDALAVGPNASLRPSPLQDYVVARLAGASGPAWLDGQGIEQAVRATEMLGAVIAFGSGQKASNMTESMWDEAGRAGWAVVSEGEAAIRTTFMDLLKHAETNPGSMHPKTAYGMLYAWMSASRLTKDPGPIRPLLREHILDTVPLTKGQILLGSPVEAPRVSSVAKIAAGELVHPMTLRNLLADQGVISASDREVPCGHIFLRYDDARASIRMLKHAVPVSRLPELLGASRPMVAALLEIGALTRLTEVEAASSKMSKAVDGLEMAAFLERMQVRLPEVAAKPTTMVTLAKAAEKGSVKLSVILSMLLQGRLQRACRLAGATGLAAVLVDPLEIKSKLVLPRPGMTGELALIILGFELSRGRRVFCHPEAEPLIVSEPYGGDVWVSPAALENFRQRYVTKKRLPLIMGARPLAIEKLLRERGVKPIWDPREFGAAIYERADLPMV
ncbi:MAG: TniQ family protein [Alteromonadaceae bacterium]|nr:TniQ family protein [Alteromonadaceae bacterium]